MIEFPPENLSQAIEVIRRQNEQLAIQSAELVELKALLESGGCLRREKTGPRWLCFFKFFAGKVGHESSLNGLEEIKRSGLFDAEVYRQQISNSEIAGWTIDRLIKDYILFGGFCGRDPGVGFDSDWYLESNPDVKASGINPLLHYIRYGRDEGRLPRHGAKPAIEQGTPNTTSGFNSRLWNGFMHVAWPELERRADHVFDRSAAWSLGAWLFAHGDVEAGMARVEQSIVNSPEGASRRDLIGRGKCYSLLGEFLALRELLSDAHMSQRLGGTMPYLQANAWHGGESKRLASINEIFYRAGLAEVARRDVAAPLSLGNLGAVAADSGEAEDLHALAAAPLVSVIVPVFNAAETLHIALNALLEQSLRSLEIIVVDDGSTDDTASVACAYAERDPRVRFLANEANIGAYPTRNHGMRMARGQFVTVHDSDDWSHPQKLERQLQPLLKDESKVASFSSWVRVLGDLTFVGPWLLNETFVEKNHSSALIRRAALDAIGLWDSVNVAADTEFLWRLEHHYGHQAIVPVLPATPLSFALSDDTTLTRTKATHVKTIHYGLRRIYREAARWWHRQGDGRPVMPASGERPFPIPLGIDRGTSREFDGVLVADFAVGGEKLAYTLRAVQAHLELGQNVCLFHWPDYNGWHGAAIADEVFALCQQYGLGFAHVGLTISAPVVVMLDEALGRYPPTQAVQIDGLERMVNGDGVAMDEQGELKAYFSNGGVDLPAFDQVA